MAFEYAASTVLNALSIDNIFQVFVATLLDQDVIIVSTSPGILSAVTIFFYFCGFIFGRTGPLNPICSPSELRILSSPFVAGVKESLPPNLTLVPCVEVNVDRDKITLHQGVKIPRLPEREKM